MCNDSWRALHKYFVKGPYFRYLCHAGARKIYQDLQQIYWLNDIKKAIQKMVAECPNCQQIKEEHNRLGGLIQYIEFPLSKWDR